MFKKLLSLGALLAISLVPSSAATISFSDTVNTTFTPSTISFTLTQFDPTLGTLTGILIEFPASLDGDFTATNQSAAAGTVSGSLTAAARTRGRWRASWAPRGRTRCPPRAPHTACTCRA